MGGGVSIGSVHTLNECLRNHLDGQAKQIVEKMNTKGFVTPDKRLEQHLTPLANAARLGKVDILEMMIRKDNLNKKKKRKIKEVHASVAILKACEYKTNARIVQLLLEECGADPVASKMGETTLHACSRLPQLKNRTDKIVWKERIKALGHLLRSGAKHSLEETDANGHTPLVAACSELNETAALVLARWGADIGPVTSWLHAMRKSTNGKFERDWVAGKILSLYAFENPKYVSDIHRRFMKQFDVNHDGWLSRDEVTNFFAAMVKVQFAAGKMPTASFVDDGSMSISQIRQLLESRCQVELSAWFSFDKNHDGEYSWKELLPLVKDFWSHIWNKNRPPEHEIETPDVDISETNESWSSKKNSQACKEKNISAASTTESATTTTRAVGTSEDKERSLPPNWLKVKDPASDNFYYANTETQESRWDFPGE
eukprot:g4489.t1